MRRPDPSAMLVTSCKTRPKPNMCTSSQRNPAWIWSPRDANWNHHSVSPTSRDSSTFAGQEKGCQNSDCQQKSRKRQRLYNYLACSLKRGWLGSLVCSVFWMCYHFCGLTLWTIGRRLGEGLRTTAPLVLRAHARKRLDLDPTSWSG